MISHQLNLVTYNLKYKLHISETEALNKVWKGHCV